MLLHGNDTVTWSKKQLHTAVVLQAVALQLQEVATLRPYMETTLEEIGNVFFQVQERDRVAELGILLEKASNRH